MEFFTAKVRKTFSAAHFIPNYSGNCRNLHGHNWTIETAITRTELDELGLSTDLREVKKVLENIIETLDHTCLNDNALLKGIPPTAENIARFIYNELEKQFPIANVDYVDVHEGPNTCIRYKRENT